MDFEGMDELESFLMQDDIESLQSIFSANSTVGDDSCQNVGQMCDTEFPVDIARFEAANFKEFIASHGEGVCSTRTDREDLLLHDIQMIQVNDPEKEKGKRQEQLMVLQSPPPPLDEEEIDEDSDDKSCAQSKNLVSERNRRHRLNQQLFTLRSLVPNITKMDKRSILVDALAYLQNLTQQIEIEMQKSSLSTGASTSSSNEGVVMEEVHEPVQTTMIHEQCAALPVLSAVEAEIWDEERFLLKIHCNKAMGALGQVYRAIEMLGLEITHISTSQYNQEIMQSTAFLRVKKKGLVITREQLLHRVLQNAKQLGLLLPPDQ